MKIKATLLRATGGDTIRSLPRTGKPARMLKSAWTEEWDDSAHPASLGMPLQPVLTARAIERIVGQIVSAMNETKPAASVVYDMVDEFVTAIEPVSYRANA